MKRIAAGFAFMLLLGTAPVSIQAAPAPQPASADKAATADQTGTESDPDKGPVTGTSETASPTETDTPSPAAAGAHESGGAASAESHETELPSVKWSFDGAFGTYDRGALQRGFQIYTQVCASCHSMNRLSYRNLTALGYSEDEVKAIAASHQVTDGPNDEGEMFQRPGLPSDRFVAPFPNKQAAASANNGAVPPDMSLLSKAREGGPSYIYGILTGYQDPPANADIPTGRYWNKIMPGHVIAMPPPLTDGQVAYEDGTGQTVDQYAKDVATFLAWASEPHMEERKRAGIKAFIFLLVFSGVMYSLKRKLWSDLH